MTSKNQKKLSFKEKLLTASPCKKNKGKDYEDDTTAAKQPNDIILYKKWRQTFLIVRYKLVLFFLDFTTLEI